MKSKTKPVKHISQKKILLGIGVFLAVTLIGCAGVFAYKFYQNTRPSKILSDAVENSGSLKSSQNGFSRLKIGFEPTKPGASVSVEFDTDGLIEDGTYKGSVKINSAIFRVPLELSGDVIGSEGDYYIKLNDIESSIQKAENENAEFKLYSSYVRQIATNLEEKWIKIANKKISGCDTTELLGPNKIKSEEVQKITDSEKSIKKLADEVINGKASYHLSSDEIATELSNVVGAKCASSKSPKIEKVDIWVSKDGREFTKISATTDSGVYSIEWADSMRDNGVKMLTVPAEFTTVDELQKLTEQIIGTPKN